MIHPYAVIGVMAAWERMCWQSWWAFTMYRARLYAPFTQELILPPAPVKVGLTSPMD